MDSLRGLPIYRVVKPRKSIYIAQLNVPRAFTEVGLGTSRDFHPICGVTLTCNAASYHPREALEAAQVVGRSSLRMQCASACETIWCFWFMPQSGVGYEEKVGFWSPQNTLEIISSQSGLGVLRVGD